jgi:hypothetical protein
MTSWRNPMILILFSKCGIFTMSNAELKSRLATRTNSSLSKASALGIIDWSSRDSISVLLYFWNHVDLGMLYLYLCLPEFHLSFLISAFQRFWYSTQICNRKIILHFMNFTFVFENRNSFCHEQWTIIFMYICLNTWVTCSRRIFIPWNKIRWGILSNASEIFGFKDIIHSLMSALHIITLSIQVTNFLPFKCWYQLRYRPLASWS